MTRLQRQVYGAQRIAEPEQVAAVEVERVRVRRDRVAPPASAGKISDTDVSKETDANWNTRSPGPQP